MDKNEWIVCLYDSNKKWNNFMLFNVHGSLDIMKKKQSTDQSMFARNTNSYYKHEMKEHF